MLYWEPWHVPAHVPVITLTSLAVGQSCTFSLSHALLSEIAGWFGDPGVMNMFIIAWGIPLQQVYVWLYLRRSHYTWLSHGDNVHILRCSLLSGVSLTCDRVQVPKLELYHKTEWSHYCIIHYSYLLQLVKSCQLFPCASHLSLNDLLFLPGNHISSHSFRLCTI